MTVLKASQRLLRAARNSPCSTETDMISIVISSSAELCGAREVTAEASMCGKTRMRMSWGKEEEKRGLIFDPLST